MGTSTNNVGIYCRLSKDDNNRNDESSSISNQKNMLIKYVMDKEWNLAKIYVDDGWSGTNYDRPDFKQMIADIEQGLVNIVLTKDLSRLGRNYVETGQYTENFFPKHNIRYIAVNDGIDTSKDDNDIAPFKNILNEMYAKDISKKVRSTKKILAEQGKFANSRAPYGYMKSPENKHLLIIDENSVDNVKRIFSMFLSGSSGRSIADTFNREDIPTPNVYYYQSIKKPNPYTKFSNQWGSGTIMNIIKNPVYKGDMVNGKRRVMSFKNKQVLKNPAENWIVVENTHEPIVDELTWDKAQQLTVKNHVGIRRNSSGEVSIFSGIVKCADCGTKMTYNRKYRSTYIDEYYRCGRYTNQGTTACNPHTIKHEQVYNAVIEDIRNFARLAYADENQLIEKVIKSNIQISEKTSLKHEKLLKEKEFRVKEIDSLMQTLLEEKFKENVPEAIFKRTAQKYDEEQVKLLAEIDNIKAELAECRQTEKDVDGWVDKIKKCLSIENLTREIVVELIESIEISEVYEKDGEQQQDINITYRFENFLQKTKRAS